MISFLPQYKCIMNKILGEKNEESKVSFRKGKEVNAELDENRQEGSNLREVM